jgi:hypothetical protein
VKNIVLKVETVQSVNSAGGAAPAIGTAAAKGSFRAAATPPITAGLVSPTGIIWDLDGDGGPVLMPASTFSSKGYLGRLRLLYRREPGAFRTEGRLELRHLRKEVL